MWPPASPPPPRSRSTRPFPSLQFELLLSRVLFRANGFSFDFKIVWKLFRNYSETINKVTEGRQESIPAHSASTAPTTAGDAATACEKGLVVLAAKPSSVLTADGGGRADGGYSVGSRGHEDNVVRRLAYIYFSPTYLHLFRLINIYLHYFNIYFVP